MHYLKLAGDGWLGVVLDLLQCCSSGTSVLCGGQLNWNSAVLNSGSTAKTFQLPSDCQSMVTATRITILCKDAVALLLHGLVHFLISVLLSLGS